jgi:predicted enzyme related to lactoylglutathione lyase
MPSGVTTIIFPADDLQASTALFAALLGTQPAHEAPYYVGFDVDRQHIGLDPNGHRNGVPGPTCYWEVDDIEAARQRLLDAGATETQPVHDVGGGKLIAGFTDSSGNPIGLTKSPW